jgi:very-short-patch-repair endonuclease
MVWSVSRARYLRRTATEAERVLWRRLRSRYFGNCKFRRQHPIGEYIVDFYCADAALVIEVDGGGHDYRTNRRLDNIRSKFLNDCGLEVLRFWNSQVHGDIEAVLTVIWATLEKRRGIPHLNPLPSAKGEAERSIGNCARIQHAELESQPT